MPVYKLSKTSYGKAFKRKRFSRKRAVRSSLKRARSLVKYNVHSYKRYATVVNYQVAAGATAHNNSFVFTLSDVRNSSEFTTLYDQYMITGVLCRFQLINNPDANNNLNVTTTSNAMNFYPRLYYVRDYDDVGIEATNDIRERGNAATRILRPNSEVKIFVRPSIRNNVYLDGVTPASSPLWRQWLDCSSAGVPHYGLKFSIDMLGVTSLQDCFVRVEKTYYLKFKNSR